MHVFFFDIDGTLIDARGAGMEALKIAFTEVFERPAPAVISTAGRTDRGIARDLFRAHAIEDSDDHWCRFQVIYEQHLADQLPRREGIVLPGVEPLLDALCTRGDIALGLLTGNTPQAARLKLEHFGLQHHFSFGGFGEREPERNAVALAAVRSARQTMDGAFAMDRLWVIGDTPLDVRCARFIGARAVAVATGFHPREELLLTAPDLLLDSLDQSAEILHLLDAESDDNSASRILAL